MSGDILSRTEKRLEEVMSAAAEAARRVGGGRVPDRHPAHPAAVGHDPRQHDAAGALPGAGRGPEAASGRGPPTTSTWRAPTRSHSTHDNVMPEGCNAELPDPPAGGGGGVLAALQPGAARDRADPRLFAELTPACSAAGSGARPGSGSSSRASTPAAPAPPNASGRRAARSATTGCGAGCSRSCVRTSPTTRCCWGRGRRRRGGRGSAPALGPPAPQRDGVALEPPLLRHHRREAAPADREPLPAFGPDDSGRGRQHGAVAGSHERLFGRGRGAGEDPAVRGRQGELPGRQPARAQGGTDLARRQAVARAGSADPGTAAAGAGGARPQGSPFPRRGPLHRHRRGEGAHRPFGGRAGCWTATSRCAPRRRSRSG